MPNNNSKARTKKSTKKAAGPKLGQRPQQTAPLARSKGVHRTRHVTEACSILNPFCIAARGARRPDGQAQGTLPFQIRGFINVVTNSEGNACTMICPGYGYFGYANAVKSTFSGSETQWSFASSAGANPNTGVWAQLPGNTFLTTNAAAVRIVSMGAKFTNIGSMTDCSGIVTCNVITSADPARTIVPNSLNNVESNTHAMTSGLEMVWLAKPLGSTAHEFRAYGITNIMADFNWSQCYFEVAGGAASKTIGIIEIVCNVEFMLNRTGVTTTGLGGVPIGPKPSNPIATRVQETVQSSIPSLFKGGVDVIEKRITDSASSAVDTLMSTIGEGLALLGI